MVSVRVRGRVRLGAHARTGRDRPAAVARLYRVPRLGRVAAPAGWVARLGGVAAAARLAAHNGTDGHAGLRTLQQVRVRVGVRARARGRGRVGARARARARAS